MMNLQRLATRFSKRGASIIANEPCTNITSRKCRGVSTSAAKKLLGFPAEYTPTVKELRRAYFEAAKECHPDMKPQQQKQKANNEDKEKQNDDDKNNKDVNDELMGGIDFRDITEAYEHLLDNGSRKTEEPEISIEEEEDYRQACLLVLGLKAEIVEESKRNPMFRNWLDGRTDGAQVWRGFFSTHGGLARKINPPAGYIESAKETRKVETRRRRQR